MTDSHQRLDTFVKVLEKRDDFVIKGVENYGYNPEDDSTIIFWVKQDDITIKAEAIFPEDEDLLIYIDEEDYDYGDYTPDYPGWRAKKLGGIQDDEVRYSIAISLFKKDYLHYAAKHFEEVAERYWRALKGAERDV